MSRIPQDNFFLYRNDRKEWADTISYKANDVAKRIFVQRGFVIFKEENLTHLIKKVLKDTLETLYRYMDMDT